MAADSRSRGDGTGPGGAGVAPLGPLLALDLAGMLAFITAGELRHGVDIVARPDQVLLTAAPFVAGWLLVAGLVGAYDERARRDVRVGVRIAVGAWIGGAGVGLTLRATHFLPGDAPLSFALVMAGLGALVIGGVRVLAIRGLADAGQREAGSPEEA